MTTPRGVLVAVVTDGPGAALLHNHPRYAVVFAAPSGSRPPPADIDALSAENEIVTPALLLDYDDVAQRLALSERKVRQLVADGELPAVRVGRCRRIRASDLAAFVEHLGDHMSIPRAASVRGVGVNAGTSSSGEGGEGEAPPPVDPPASTPLGAP